MAVDFSFDVVDQIVQVGKQKGYVSHDEVDDMLPGDRKNASDLQDVLAGLYDAGVELVESPNNDRLDGVEDQSDLDVSLAAIEGGAEKTSDPVRAYLREM